MVVVALPETKYSRRVSEVPRSGPPGRVSGEAKHARTATWDRSLDAALGGAGSSCWGSGPAGASCARRAAASPCFSCPCSFSFPFPFWPLPPPRSSHAGATGAVPNLARISSSDTDPVVGRFLSFSTSCCCRSFSSALRRRSCSRPMCASSRLRWKCCFHVRALSGVPAAPCGEKARGEGEARVVRRRRRKQPKFSLERRFLLEFASQRTATWSGCSPMAKRTSPCRSVSPGGLSSSAPSF